MYTLNRSFSPVSQYSAEGSTPELQQHHRTMRGCFRLHAFLRALTARMTPKPGAAVLQ